MEMINKENEKKKAVRTVMKKVVFGLFISMVVGITGCSDDNDASTVDEVSVEKNLVTFDTLDFVVFSNQEWTRLHESHDQNIKVVMPDGTVTIGLDTHINNLKWIFSFAPDTRIKEHPIRFGSGKYTAVTGFMEGTFTKPMYLPNGTAIPPTGKTYKLSMATIGIWSDGVMIEEQLFWDNRNFFNQLGI